MIKRLLLLAYLFPLIFAAKCSEKDDQSAKADMDTPSGSEESSAGYEDEVTPPAEDPPITEPDPGEGSPDPEIEPEPEPEPEPGEGDDSLPPDDSEPEADN